LNPRDDIERAIQLAALQAFRGHKVSEAGGRITGIGHAEQVLEGVHKGHPYGQEGNSPAAAELVYLETAGGLIVVTERNTLPSGVTACATGESQTYGNGGSYHKHTAAGDQVLEPKPGQFLKLGAGAVEFIAMANLVMTELEAQRKWINEHVHPTAATGPPSAPTPPLMEAPSSVAATKAKVE